MAIQYSIAIVDDHILIAKAIASIIIEHSSYQVLYEVANGKMLQEKFKQAKNIPDVVLLDISMPIMDGFETAQWMKENYPEVLILTLSMQDDDESLIRMIKCGAKGYLLKNVEPKELIYAINQLIQKGFYYPEWATGKVFKSLGQEELISKSEIKITDREQAFLQLSCSEMSYKEIAEKMFCSPRTVEGYRDALFEKLEIRTRVGLVLYALRNKLIKLDT
jgi:DNA-binding NarL/FixJ family response regulator